jgi:sugar phosphate isomerase/epimerase
MHMVSPAGLTLSSLTLGDVSFAARVQAAASAGFSGIGLRAEDYVAAREAGLDDASMAGLLGDHGVSVTEVELLVGWGEPAMDPLLQEKEATIAHVARTFAADHVNAALFAPRQSEQVTAGFVRLCSRLRDLTVALEFMPFGGLPDLAAAWDIVRRADQPNAGLIVDAWHWARSGAVAADLTDVPAGRIAVIQVADVGEEPMSDLRQETLHHRLPPGRGSGDVAGLLRALHDHGVTAPVSVEVMSDELLAAGPDSTALQVMSGAAAVLAAATDEREPAG